MVLRMIVVRMLKNRLQHCTKYRFLNLNTTFVHDMTVILNWILDLHEMILFNYCRIVLQEWLSFVDHVSKLLSHSSSYWWGEENSHPNLYPDSSKVTSFTRCKPDNFLKWSSDSNWTIPLNISYPLTVPGFPFSWKNIGSPFVRFLRRFDLHSNFLVPVRIWSNSFFRTTSSTLPSAFGWRILFRKQVGVSFPHLLQPVVSEKEIIFICHTVT